MHGCLNIKFKIKVRFSITPQIGESLRVVCGYQGISDQFAGDPWMHVKNNQGMSVIGNMFISYDRTSN